MSSALVRSAAIVFTAVLLGCPPGKSNNTPSDAGSTVDFVGRSCNVDAECGSLRCDKVRRQCICLSDESCKSADPAAPIRYCNNYTGLCVEEISGCRSDADCAAIEYCDSSIRSCRPKKSFCEPCAGDNECGGDGDNCVLDATLNQKFCGKACEANSDCARGASCQEHGGVKQCWPAPNPLTPNETPSCENFKGCTPDSLRACDSNAECAELGDQRCDTAQGRCVAIQQACAFGTVCDPRNKICVAECAADADCGDAKLRCVNRVCEPVNDCTTDAQCPQNKVCSVPAGATTGQCVPFCQSDSECPLGQICTQSADARYRCEPGCSSNTNCPIDQRCNLTTKQCEGPTVNGARTCQATTACNTCELCDATKYECTAADTSFPYCSACSSPTQCAGGTCVLMDDGQFCAKFCGSGQECPQGFVCLTLGGGAQSACVPSDRKCTQKCP